MKAHIVGGGFGGPAPMVAWLRPRGGTILTGVFVRDIGFAPSRSRMTASRLDYEHDGGQRRSSSHPRISCW
jgi:hypothetical protein